MLSAQMIATALGGKRANGYWMAKCPAHKDRTPSLQITEKKDGKVLVRCHAGCSQEAVVGELSTRGLWEKTDLLHASQRPVASQPVVVADDSCDRIDAAIELWSKAIPAQGTLVEHYLNLRGIDSLIPADIAYYPELQYPGNGMWPAMVSLVRDSRSRDGTPIAVHRTYLSTDGCKAPLDPPRKMLGPMKGGVVRLAPYTGWELMVGEGIETCLSAMIIYRPLPAWAALSSSNLKSLALPSDIRRVCILSDRDPAGEEAAKIAARRWQSEGRLVRIKVPRKGNDFNDMLMATMT